MSQTADTAPLHDEAEESQVLQPDPKPLSEGTKSQSKKKLEERSRKAAAKLSGAPVDDPKEQLPVVTRERRRVVFSLPQEEHISASGSARESKKRKHRSPSKDRSPSKEKRSQSPSKDKKKKKHKSGVTMINTSITKKAKSGALSTTEKKPRRYRPGTVAAREIRKFSWNKADTKFFRRGPLNRIIDEILASYSMGRGLRMKKSAREALIGEAEDWTVRLLRGSNQCAQHCGRDTLFQTDIQFFQNQCTHFAGKDLQRLIGTSK